MRILRGIGNVLLFLAVASGILIIVPIVMAFLWLCDRRKTQQPEVVLLASPPEPVIEPRLCRRLEQLRQQEFDDYEPELPNIQTAIIVFLRDEKAGKA